MRAFVYGLLVALASCGGALAVTQDQRDACDKPDKHDAAIAACTAIIDAGDKDYGVEAAYLNRGAAYDEKGDHDRAIADYNEAIRLDPKDADAYLNRGDAYSDKGDYDRAAADYNEAIRIKPDFADAYNARAWKRLKTGKAEDAKPDADKAVSLAPRNSEARDTRGHILLALGDTKGALADFNEALRLKADLITAFWGRGQAYERLKLRSLALADYKRAIELNPTSPDDIDAQQKALERLAELEATAPAPNEARKPSAPMGRRVALVIGNSAYKAVPELANPKSDAAAVAGELTRLGFEVIEKHDLGAMDMRRALGDFEDKATGAEWALVYYSGHGMELNGQNWLIPVDAQLARANDVPDEAVPLDRVLDRVRIARRMRIVILDACRNNPFRAKMAMNGYTTRAVERGLVPVEPSHGEVVFYAARDGHVALDGKDGNSPFAEALVKHMDEDGVELGRFFRKVTGTVLAATNNQQEPFVYGRIPDEDFYFKPPK